MKPTRRRFLGTVGTGFALGLAGCSSDGTSGSDGQSNDTPADGGGGDDTEMGGGSDNTATDGGSDGSSGAVVETTSVTMVDTQFDPRNVHVDPGATVTWTNEDSASHTVTSASDNWSKDSEVGGGEKTSHTFEESDVYDVYCVFHGSADLSGMSMKVAVGDATIDDPLGGASGGDSGGGDGSDSGGGGSY